MEIKYNLRTFHKFISVEVESALVGAFPPRLLDQQWSAYNFVGTSFPRFRHQTVGALLVRLNVLILNWRSSPSLSVVSKKPCKAPIVVVCRTGHRPSSSTIGPHAWRNLLYRYPLGTVTSRAVAIDRLFVGTPGRRATRFIFLRFHWCTTVIISLR